MKELKHWRISSMEINILAIIQALFFFGYAGYVWNRLGVIHSISQSFYDLQPFKKNHLFMLFAAGVGLPMLGFSKFMPDNDASQMVFALSGFFMFMIGVAATFRESKMVSTIHYGCTLLAIGFAYFGIYLQYHDWYFWWFLLAGAIGSGIIWLVLKENKIWWIENYVFTLLIGRLILHNLI